MIRDVLQSIGGVEIYAIMGLLLFFGLFLFILIRVIKMDKNELQKYSRIPLEDTRLVKPAVVSSDVKNANKGGE
ncbi:MAG: cbb3-type cytochrome c oxidase subunit 3 [Candidatus Zixiibacteriota bacterium]